MMYLLELLINLFKYKWAWSVEDPSLAISYPHLFGFVGIISRFSAYGGLRHPCDL